jgi:hypothetical protein
MGVSCALGAVVYYDYNKLYINISVRQTGNRNFIKKFTDRKTINSSNYAKFEVNWPRGSQFTARHTKNRLQFDE